MKGCRLPGEERFDLADAVQWKHVDSGGEALRQDFRGEKRRRRESKNNLLESELKLVGIHPAGDFGKAFDGSGARTSECLDL